MQELSNNPFSSLIVCSNIQSIPIQNQEREKHILEISSLSQTVESISIVVKNIEKKCSHQNVRSKILEQIWELDSKIRSIRIQIILAYKPIEKEQLTKQLAELHKKGEELSENLFQLDQLTNHLDESSSAITCQGIDIDYLLKVSGKELVEIAKSQLTGQEKLPTVKLYLNPDLVDPILILESLLKDHTGICIGEKHDETGYNFLKENITYLRLMGVTSLFFEGIRYEDQPIFNQFFETGNLKDLRELPYYKNDKNSDLCKQIELEFDLFKDAQKAGIRIIGIDSKSSGNVVDGDRILAMNLFSNEIIFKEKGKGKFIALVGAAHLTSIYKGAFTGLADLQQCPSIEIYKFGEEVRVQRLFQTLFGKMRLKPHITLLRDMQGRIKLHSKNLS